MIVVALLVLLEKNLEIGEITTFKELGYDKNEFGLFFIVHRVKITWKEDSEEHEEGLFGRQQLA